jgi:hypothetical protein
MAARAPEPHERRASAGPYGCTSPCDPVIFPLVAVTGLAHASAVMTTDSVSPVPESIGTHQKALRINLDKAVYGTFAEIGAGQEVARWFFRVGGASGTIAKTISAYDMQVSDAIYGKCERYVGRQRLNTMLDHEFGLLLERLREKRGADTRFFAFAETVAAQGYIHRDECHGWIGIRFQSEPGAEPSQIILHVRMLDQENLPQQEALGIIGVNLIYGAFHHTQDPKAFIQSLLDDLTPARISVDMIKFSGPAYDKVDNRLMSLQLVQRGLTQAAMFTANGEVVNAADALYKKPILVERGSFRPVTKVTLDMLNCAQAQFVQEPGVEGEETLVLMEMTLKNLTDGGAINHQDFLDRVDILSTLGRSVLISNYAEFHRLASYLFRFTKKKIGIVMGVPTLREIFDEKYYADLEGGILESFGRMFKNDLKLYVYPLQDSKTGALITSGNLRVAPNLRHLYAYLYENRYIEGLKDYDEKCLPILSRTALAKIKSGDSSWEVMVPTEVAKIIKERRLLGYQEKG